MADRKQFQTSLKADPKLDQLLEEARAKKVSEEELQEQRISFAFGNAPEDSELITKDTVRHSSEHILMTNIIDPPDVDPFQANNPAKKDLRLAAAQFLSANPEVYDLYVRFAREMIQRGRRFSINLLTERVRYETFMTWDHDDGFKVNNNHRPYVARKLIEEYPEFAPFLRCRQTRY